jgi:histone H3/H4
MANDMFNVILTERAMACLTAGIEYIAAEVLELSGNKAHEYRLDVINTRHVRLAICNDKELHETFESCCFANSGAFPFIHSTLEPLEGAHGNDDESMAEIGIGINNNGITDGGGGLCPSIDSLLAAALSADRTAVVDPRDGYHYILDHPNSDPETSSDDGQNGGTSARALKRALHFDISSSSHRSERMLRARSVLLPGQLVSLQKEMPMLLAREGQAKVWSNAHISDIVRALQHLDIQAFHRYRIRCIQGAQQQTYQCIPHKTVQAMALKIYSERSDGVADADTGTAGAAIDGGLRFTQEAMHVLHIGLEDYLIGVLLWANMLAISSGRKYVSGRDVKAAAKIMS